MDRMDSKPIEIRLRNEFDLKFLIYGRREPRYWLCSALLCSKTFLCLQGICFRNVSVLIKTMYKFGWYYDRRQWQTMAHFMYNVLLVYHIFHVMIIPLTNITRNIPRKSRFSRGPHWQTDWWFSFIDRITREIRKTGYRNDKERV